MTHEQLTDRIFQLLDGLNNNQIYEIVDIVDEYIKEHAPEWIPFKTRPLTEEEKEEYPEWDTILDCELPDDGQEILVNIKYKGHEAVQMDEFCADDGCYLDSGYEIGEEATAWMPKPKPLKGETE